MSYGECFMFYLYFMCFLKILSISCRFLCLQNFITANTVFFKYTAQHPDFSGLGPPYQKPLLNFVWFLLLVIERFDYWFLLSWVFLAINAPFLVWLHVHVSFSDGNYFQSRPYVQSTWQHKTITLPGFCFFNFLSLLWNKHQMGFPFLYLPPLKF